MKTKKKTNATKEIGLLYRTLRVKAGLSQMELASVMRCTSAQSVSNIERGITTFPAHSLKVVAKALKIKPDVLVGIHVARERVVLMKAARL